MSDRSGSPGRFGLDGAPDGVPGRRGADVGHDHHGSNDHLASIYEDPSDQFAAVVPFLREGLERGERCLYVAADNTEAEVLAALREGGIDVDAARESGALSVYSKADTYLRTGEFDRDAMLDFWREALAAARDEDGFAGVRAAAEMTWALDEDTDLDRLVAYEAALNSLYDGDDYVVLCQYDRERFPADVVSDVVRSHPLVVYDGTVCRNDHYHPPEEFFGEDRPPLDLDRTIEGLVGRARTAEAIRERERYLRELYEITSSPDRSFEEKLQSLFDLGCERFDLELGGMARIDPVADMFEVEYVSGDHEHLEPGARVDLSETYCRVHAEDGAPTGITDPEAEGFDGSTAYEEFGVRSYLGTRLTLEHGLDRTFFFVSTETRHGEFTEAERTFCRLMGQWVRQELDRKEHERALEESNERLEQFAHAASHDLQEPLRMVSSYLQLIEHRYGDELDEDGREFIEYAVGGADRMRQMIDGLLQYARVETRGEQPEPIDLDAVLDDVLADLQFQIDGHHATVTAGDLPRVEGDGNQLRQVFQNLLDNAIEYSGDDPPRVHVDAERAGDRWVVSVSDEGIGIEPSDQERVFEVFQRLHTHDEHEGTGIGLALCRRIVERHGGDIRIDSEPGEGTTVSFTLAAADGSGE